jgi:predicted enzyme related to lactoylglutathione lyase
MPDNPVVWFEIYVQDMERARRFYESVFGFSLQRLDSPDPGMEMWSFPMQMDGPGAAGALARMDGIRPGGNGTMVYFRSEDCAVEAARVTKAGGRIHREKTSIGQYGFIALGYDTEGNLFGIHSMK